MTLIASIHPGSHDSAVALFDDYCLIAAVQKERLTRIKKDGGCPHETLDEVLAIAGASRRDVDVVVFSRSEFPQPLYRMDPFRRLRSHLRGDRERLRGLSMVMNKKGRSAEDLLDLPRTLDHYGLKRGTRVVFGNHHFAHALSSLFFTEWEDALLYTADGGGDNVNYSHRLLRGGRIETFYGDDRSLPGPYPVDSVGRAYEAVTIALGFKPRQHEGKITGLAAWGKPTLTPAFSAHFRVDEQGRILSDFPTIGALYDFFAAQCATETRENASASIQQFIEDWVTASVRRLLEIHKTRRLALAGGVFANVKLNQRLAETCPIDELFIAPPMGDEGLAVGGALQYLLERDGLKHWLDQRRRLDTLYLGRPFPDAGKRFAAHSPRIRKLDGDPAAKTAELLEAGKAVAIFSERMEFGPRALGARSILAAPARRDINDSLNKRLDRSEFMPFAPVVAEEDAQTLFDVGAASHYACRFMTITCSVKPQWRDRIAAVVHVDNTARPQIIRRSENPLYYDILTAYKARSGLPTLVNTSFNVHEQPIINTPEEAATALVEGRVDQLVSTDGVWGLADGD